MIKPTVGRIVWFRDETNQEGQPYAAIITFVHTDRMVNLNVFEHGGFIRPKTSVQLVQKEDEFRGAQYCEWMPYQIGQAKKHEESSK